MLLPRHAAERSFLAQPNYAARSRSRSRVQRQHCDGRTGEEDQPGGRTGYQPTDPTKAHLPRRRQQGDDEEVGDNASQEDRTKDRVAEDRGERDRGASPAGLRVTEGLRELTGDGRHCCDPTEHCRHQRSQHSATHEQRGNLPAMRRRENAQEHQRSAKEQA